MKRLVIEVEEVLHREIKKRAAVKGLSIRAYLMDAVFEYIKKEKKRE